MPADGEGHRLDVAAAVRMDAPRDLRDVRRFSHEAMHTVFEVYAAHPDERYAAQAAQAAFDLVDRLERDLSRFVPNSDIARVNDLPPGGRTRVSEATLECLVIARHVFDLTGGAFDPSIGSGLPLLELDAGNFEVRAGRGGVRLDLGAIGKGYAVDLVADLLEEWDVGRALVHGGFSSVLALEPPGGREGWPLTISDPNAPSRVLARLSVRQAALGASGLQKGTHILDPRTQQPPRGRLAAWAEVPRLAEGEGRGAEGGTGSAMPRAATVADALTTAFMLLPAGDIRALCESNPGLEAWILEEPPAASSDVSLLHFGR